jgi:hypothetical protein
MSYVLLANKKYGWFALLKGKSSAEKEHHETIIDNENSRTESTRSRVSQLDGTDPGYGPR